MQTVKRIWPVCLLCAVSLLAMPAGLLAQEAAATAEPKVATTDLLKVIPADTTGFLAIRNLKELDGDIIAMSTKLGFPLGPEGMFPGPLDWLKSAMQINEGLNENGGVALVLLDASKIKSVDEIEDHLLIYVAASDPKALITSMGGEEGQHGTYKIDLAGSPSVAAIKDKYVLITKAPADDTTAPEALQAAMKAEGEGVIKTMSPDRVRAFAMQDISLWVNFRNLSPELRKEITDGIQSALGGLGGLGMGASNPAEADIAAVGTQLNKYLEEAEELNIGLTLNARNGLGLTLYNRAKPDSDAAKMIAAMPPVKGSVLAGLPDDAPILVAGGSVPVTDAMLKQIRETAERLTDQVSKMDTDAGSPLTPEGLKPLIDTYVDLIANAQSFAVSVSNLAADTEQTDTGTLGLTVVARVKDAKAWRERLHKGFDQVKQVVAGVAKADGTEQAKIDEILGAFEWKEAGTAAEESVDQMAVDLSKIPEATPETIEKIKKVVGPDGIMVRIATVGDNTVVVLFGGGEKRLTDVIGLVKQNQAPLAKNERFSKVLSRMPKGQVVAEVFFDLQNLLGLVEAITTRAEVPLPVKLSLKGALPLAAITNNVDKTAQEVHVLIPTELIISTADMVRQQLLPMMMGGMGGGQPGMGVPDQDGNENSQDSDGGNEKEEKPAKPKQSPQGE